MTRVMKKRGLTLCTFVLALALVATGFTAAVYAATAVADVEGEDGSYVGRDFDGTYDRMLDPFDGSATRATEGDVTPQDKAYLSVAYDNNCNTNDGAIYKNGNNFNENMPAPILVLRMRTNAALSTKIADLDIAFGHDLAKYQQHNYSFDEMVSPDGDPMPELTAQFQDYKISLSQLDGTYLTKDNQDSSINVASSIWGFHLKAKENKKGLVEISEIYYAEKSTDTYASTKTKIDNFEQRTNVGSMPYDADTSRMWWLGSEEGVIVTRSITLRNGSYQVTAETANQDGAYGSVVLHIKKGGAFDAAKLKIAPVYGSEGSYTVGDAKNWSALKGPTGKALPALTDSYAGVVVDLAQSGWTDIKASGIKLIAETGCTATVNQVFFTNMEYEAPISDYPILDVEDILMFDDFNRDRVGAYASYDESVQSGFPEQYGLSCIIGYNEGMMSRMSMENGCLVFDFTSDDSYLQYTAQAIVGNENEYDFAVFRMKATDGAGLETFRISTVDDAGARSEVRWANGALLSDAGLPVAGFDQEGYPYRTNDGFQYVVIDLAKSGLQTKTNGFDIFMSGGGKLYIDEIFYCNRYQKPDEDNTILFDDFNRAELKDDNHDTSGGQVSIADGAVVMDASNNEHAWLGAKSTQNNKEAQLRYLVLKMKGDKDTDLESFRMQSGAAGEMTGERYFNAGNLISLYGRPLQDVTEEYQLFIIDLEASGLHVDAEEFIFTFGDWGKGKLYIDEIYFAGEAAVPDYHGVLSARDEVGPEISLTLPESATAGDTIVVAPIVTDNVDSASQITVDITVKKDGTEIRLTNGSFTAEEGTYTIEITAKDSAGNPATATKTLTVKAKADSRAGCGCGTVGFPFLGGMGLLLGCGILAIFAVKLAMLKKRA